jgi:hypothetical protein
MTLGFGQWRVAINAPLLLSSTFNFTREQRPRSRGPSAVCHFILNDESRNLHPAVSGSRDEQET